MTDIYWIPYYVGGDLFSASRIHSLVAIGVATSYFSARSHHLKPGKNMIHYFLWAFCFMYELLYSYAYLLSLGWAFWYSFLNTKCLFICVCPLLDKFWRASSCSFCSISKSKLYCCLDIPYSAMVWPRLVALTLSLSANTSSQNSELYCWMWILV